MDSCLKVSATCEDKTNGTSNPAGSFSEIPNADEKQNKDSPTPVDIAAEENGQITQLQTLLHFLLTEAHEETYDGLCDEQDGMSNTICHSMPEQETRGYPSNLSNFRKSQVWGTLAVMQSNNADQHCTVSPNGAMWSVDEIELKSPVFAQEPLATTDLTENSCQFQQLTDDCSFLEATDLVQECADFPCTEKADNFIKIRLDTCHGSHDSNGNFCLLSSEQLHSPSDYSSTNCCVHTPKQVILNDSENLYSMSNANDENFPGCRLNGQVVKSAEVSSLSVGIADHSPLVSSEADSQWVTKNDVLGEDMPIQMALEITSRCSEIGSYVPTLASTGVTSSYKKVISSGDVLSEQESSPSSVDPLCHLEISLADARVRGAVPPYWVQNAYALFGKTDKRRMSSRRLKRDPIQYKQKTTEVGILVEQQLRNIFVPFESVEIQLVRQCRDILLCTYQGNFQRFKELFLTPAASLLQQLKSSVIPVAPSTCSLCAGWPLCFNRRLVIQLGELDKALLKPGDFYLCIRQSFLSEDCPLVYFCVRYRTRVGQGNTGGEVRERRIDEKNLGSVFATMDWMESSGPDVPMNDEHLTTVLQHLLLSVERGIERLEWDSSSRNWPLCSGQTTSRCCHGSVMARMMDISVQTNPEHGTCISEGTSKQQSSDLGRTQSCLTKTCELPAGKILDKKCLIHDQETTDNNSFVSGISESIQNPHESSTSALNKDCELQLKTASDEDFVRLTSDSNPNDDEPDDGYYEHTITQPNTVSQVQDVLQEKIAILPGSRDRSGRSVVVISCFPEKENSSVSPCQLAQLLLYFQTIPKKDVVSKGFLFLIDAKESSEEFWNLLDETFCLLEANVSNAVSQVLVFSSSSLEIPRLFKTSRVQFELIKAKETLQSYIRKDQLLPSHGGTYAYDHQEWISFRKFLEPFINGCRLSGRHLVSLLEELRGSRLPPSSTLTLQMIEQQKKSVRATFQDEHLMHLKEEGETVLKELESYRTRAPHNADYRENLERTNMLYEDLRKAMCKLSKLADKRLRRLEECLQRRTFQEESSQVLTWLCKKGVESLEKHQSVADHLGGIKEQEEEFEKFYFLATRQLERGNDLLEEASMLGHEVALPKIREDCQISEEEGGMSELATTLRQRLGSFSEQLECTRERIEDTAKCYQMMDRSYEWALDAMRFVSQMGLPNIGSPEVIARQIRGLQDYLDDHLPVSDDAFLEIMDLASRSGSDKLSDQCNVAKQKCQETLDLLQTRLLALMKVKQQMEVDSFRVPHYDSEDSVPNPRTTRSHSQPANMWNPAFMQSSYPMCLSHYRRRSESSALSTVPQSYGSPSGSYTSFPSSYYPAVKDSQEKDEQILQRGLITEDLTDKGPVACISRGLLDSRISHKEGPPSLASPSSSTGSGSSKGITTSVLRSSGRGLYGDSSNSNNFRWTKKQPRKSQTWHLKDEALDKIKNEVREQNSLLHVDQISSSQDSGSLHSLDSDSVSSPRNCSKASTTHAKSDASRGPVPVNTHLMSSVPGSESEESPDVTSDVPCDVEAKSKKTLMLIMKEMIQTERDYVKSLEYIIDNYIPELLREDIPQALRGQRNVVFGNIEKINEFHSLYFLNELEQCEHTPFTVGQCFLKYEPQFYLYALYNKNKPKSDGLIIEYGHSFFKNKQLELEDKMDLASYLLKPVQRMGKYALLLKQLLKECPEREAEHQDLKAAEEMVRFQLRHGNDLLAMDALRDCDVNVKEQGKLLRQDEFLVWQGRSKKSLRHVFLFEDLILFSKARRDPQRKGYEMYQYKQSIKTTDMGMTEQIGDSPTKFEIWFRKRKLNDTFLLQAFSPDIKVAWVNELSKLLWKQALRNRQMRLAEMSSMGIGNKPCLDIKPSEDQINDRSINYHQLTKTPRFRNSVGMPPYDVKNNKRPHSIISVSSSSSSGSSQSSFTFYGTLNLGFEPGDSPRPLHRSLTQQSQCSTESGFCTDASTAGDSPVDCEKIERHKKAERSDSLLSSDSVSTNTTPSEINCSPCEDSTIDEDITTSM